MRSPIPLPFRAGHQVYSDGVPDDYGNSTPGWADAVDVPCVWWNPSSTESVQQPTGGDRPDLDTVLVVASGVVVDHRDRFVLDAKTFEVIGLPKDYDHGPFGFAPGRKMIELKFVG